MTPLDIHPKVTGATVGAAVVALLLGLLGHFTGKPIPPTIIDSAQVIGAFLGGYIPSSGANP